MVARNGKGDEVDVELPPAGEEAAASRTSASSTKTDEELVYIIRANQGHTIEVGSKPFTERAFFLRPTLTFYPDQVDDLDLTEITSPDEIPVVVHGTYMRNWDSICEFLSCLLFAALHRLISHTFASFQPKRGFLGCSDIIFIVLRDFLVKKELKGGRNVRFNILRLI